MNKKFLYSDKAILYGREGRLSSLVYDSLAKAAYNSIAEETNSYNTKASNGKWAGIMSMQPRNLPVFAEPKNAIKQVKINTEIRISVEGSDSDSLTIKKSVGLPTFDGAVDKKYFIDLFLTKNSLVNFGVTTSAPWIKLSTHSGRLTSNGLNSQQRVWVSIDPEKLPERHLQTGHVTIKAGKEKFDVIVRVNKAAQIPRNFSGFIAADDHVSIYANQYQQIENAGFKRWSAVSGLGASNGCMESVAADSNYTGNQHIANTPATKKPVLAFRFYTQKDFTAEIKVTTLPTFPLNNNSGMRYGISVNDSPITILNFKTTGLNDEWKQSVLSNAISRAIGIPRMPSGVHTLKIYMIDPGVINGHILITLGQPKPFYGLLEESTFVNGQFKN